MVDLDTKRERPVNFILAGYPDQFLLFQELRERSGGAQ